MGIDFAHLGMESGMGFEGVMGVYMNVIVASIPSE